MLSSSFQETFPLDEENQPEPETLSRSWHEAGNLLTRFSRRPSGQSQLSDAEVPLLGDEQRSPVSPSAWPSLTLRASSVTTRKLRVGSWGADGSAGEGSTPLAGGYTASPFLPHQPSQPPGATAASEALPILSPVAATPLDLPGTPRHPHPGGAGGGGEQGKQRSRMDRTVNAAVCGAVSTFVTLPVVLSFAAIIFRDPFFQPLLGSLVKVVFLSSAIHQLAFTLFSSMPFAVGQVQDVGLIFLSAMASAVVEVCSSAGVKDEDIISTALLTLTASTALVGLLIIMTGLLKLASLVQYVPLPVVGGYLAYVGYFCLAAGVSLASGVQVSTPPTWLHLADPNALLKLAPSVACVVLIAVTLRRSRSPFTLPLLLVGIPLGFYLVLWTMGLRLADAQEAGWVTKPQASDAKWRFWEAWGLYNIHKFPPDNIYWRAMPLQAGKLVALYFVVAFGSSMDVAAIQADSPRDLDYNSELVTVGISNLATGLAGVGFTGSYIFSQTLFCMRMGVDTPLMGCIIAVSELLMFMLPLNVMTFVPNLFFGALVIWIGYDILKDWLFIAYKRVSPVEYALLLGTLTSIMALGLEAGIAVGIVAAAVHFAYSYAKVTVKAFSVVPSRSGAVRTFEQRTALEMFSARITAVSLSGYLFFGSSVKVQEQVIKVATATLESQPHEAPPGPLLNGAHAYVERQQAQHAQQGQQGAQQAQQQHGGGAGKRAGKPPSLPTVTSGIQLDEAYDGLAHFSGVSREWAVTSLQQAPRFLLLDFRRVQGLDATAARTFVTLHSRLHRMGIQLIITHLPASRPGIRKLLTAQGLILRQPGEAADGEESAGPAVRWFGTMEAGLHHCEEAFLEVAVRHRLCKPTPQCVTLAEVLRSHLEFPRSILPVDLDTAAAGALLGRFATLEQNSAGQVLFERGEAADDIFIIERGSVLCAVDFMAASVHSRAAERALGDAGIQRHHRLFKYGPGGICGELDFYLQRPRSFSAIVDQAGAAWRLSRRSAERLAREQPHVLALLQTIILRSTCLSAAHALEALERSSPE